MVLIAVGVAVTVFFPPASVLGTMLIGAGVSGLVSDVIAAINPPDNMSDYNISWGIGLGLGALTAPLGGVGTTLGKAAGQLVKSNLLLVAIRVAVQGAVGASIGAPASVTNQLIFNAITGRDLTEGLGTAAWMGAVGSLAGETLGAGMSPFKTNRPMHFTELVLQG